MPNWCYNHIEVFDLDEDGKERERFFSEEEFATTTPLQKYLPMSEYHKTMEGYNDGGYEWCNETWGTKWPENDLCYLGEDPSLAFAFDSPWCPPIVGYQKISKMFPELFFLHYWREDGMCFAGTAIYHNGSAVFMREVEGKDFPVWHDSYENNSDEYDAKLEEMMDHLMGEAHRTLQMLMHIE